MKRIALLGIVLGALSGCGGQAMSDEDDPAVGGATTGGAGGSTGGVGGSTASGGASTGGASTGGVTSSGGTAGQCVVKGDGWSANIDPTCDDLGVMAVTSTQIVDQSGDGSVSPGESFQWDVVLAEVAGEGFSVYPGVKFESDNPEVSIAEDDWFYAIFACESYTTGGTGKVGPNVAPGTVVKLTARVAMLNTDCPSAPATSVEIVVK